MLNCEGTLYIFIIIAALGLRSRVLRRYEVKNHHIISLGFEMRSPSGITSLQSSMPHTELTYLIDTISEKLVQNCIIPAIKHMRAYPGLADTLISLYGMDFHNTNSMQIYLDNIPTK